MLHHQKHFSIEEARTLLPLLQKILNEAHHAQRELTRSDEELGRRLTDTGGDIGGAIAAEMLQHLAAVNDCLHRITAMGIVVKDIGRGLVDFPHLRDGQEVYLCWEMDEDDIEFWHDLDDGYAGRERL